MEAGDFWGPTSAAGLYGGGGRGSNLLSIGGFYLLSIGGFYLLSIGGPTC